MANKMQALEISMAGFDKEIKFIKESQKESKEQNSKEHQEMLEKMDTFIGSCDKKYAPYSLYEIFVWGVRIVVGALILGLLALIGKAYLYIY